MWWDATLSRSQGVKLGASWLWYDVLVVAIAEQEATDVELVVTSEKKAHDTGCIVEMSMMMAEANDIEGNVWLHVPEHHISVISLDRDGKVESHHETSRNHHGLVDEKVVLY